MPSNQVVEAVVKAEHAGRPFDVILMDISMVRMNGDEVCKQMRGAGFNIPMVAMTGVFILLLKQRDLLASWV